MHIVTVPHDILHKAISMCGRDLDALSLDTVQMFDRDAKAAGFTLATGPAGAGRSGGGGDSAGGPDWIEGGQLPLAMSF
ncbi:MAG: hypothetical protein WDN28_25510 [Chthoniobacter sp.]